jgi:acyl carrier protein
MDVGGRIVAYVRDELVAGRNRRVDVDTPLLDGLLDSIDLMRLVAFVEEDLEVSLDHTELTRDVLRSVRTLARYVAERSTTERADERARNADPSR